MIPVRVNLPRLLLPSLLVTLAALTACRDRKPPAPAPPGPSDETISGRERVGWTQTGNSPAEIATYRYSLYIDGQRTILEDYGCAPGASDATFDCSAPLPRLTAGRHTLELAAFFLWGDEVIEGPRSAALQVTIAGVVTPIGPGSVQGGTLASSDGQHLSASIVSRGLTAPIDIAVAPDGRVFVAQRGGAVRLVDPRRDAGSTASADDNVLAVIGDMPAPDNDVTLRALALSADFSRSGFVYLACMTSNRGGAVVRVARVRELEGRFGEAATLATIPVSSDKASVTLRTGPDGHLYLAVGADRTADVEAPPGASAGRILRLKADGTTPDDNPRRSPLFSSGHHDLRGVAWRPQDPSIWQVERHARRDLLARTEPGVDPGLAAPDADRAPGVLLLPPDSDPSGLAAVHATDSPFFGDLIVSTRAGEDLLRVRIAEDGTLRLRARLLQRRFGRVAQVAAAPDGSLYFVTDNENEWGPGQELLVRVEGRERE